MKEEGMSQDAGLESAGTATESFVPPPAQPQKKAEPERLIRLSAWGPTVAGWGERGLKHAITEFLDNLLSGAYDTILAPCIAFGTMTLKLWRDTGSYVAYGEPTGDVPPRVRIPDMELHSSAQATELEYKLRWFVRHPRWRTFIVHFCSGRALRIWKKPDGYGIVGLGLPTPSPSWTAEELWDWHTHS